MDIKGAKALKDRLGANGEAERLPARARGDLGEGGVPPVYQWLGVSRPRPEATEADADDDAATTASLFRRLGLGFSTR